MKTIRLAEPRRVNCVELERPVPGSGQALIRTKTAGTCGSGISASRGTNKLVSYPRIIGYELAGIIEEIPADNLKGLKVGDKVIVDSYLYCGTCYPCSIGRTNCCTSLKVLGVYTDRGTAEYYCHPTDMLVKMPEDMDWTDVTMVEPLTISLHGIYRGGLEVEEHCAIIGADPIGPLAGMIAQAYGAHATFLDLVQERLDFARELGVEYVINSREENPVERVSEIMGETMAQQVMECSGANVAVFQTLDLVSHAGRITLIGQPSKEIPIPTDITTRKETDICGVRTSAREFEEAIELIYTEKMDVVKILIKTIGLEEAPETIRDIGRNPGNYTKAVVKTD